MRSGFYVASFAAVTALTAACSSDEPTSVSRTDATTVASVVPAGGSTGVEPAAPITIVFSHAMSQNTQMYVALHEGGVTGPEVPGTWAWSSGYRTLTFTPESPLGSQTQYSLHVGGGITDANGEPVDFGPCQEQHGGQWATEQMMTGGGMQNMMGPGWQHANGSYGMIFTFTTA